MAQEDDYTAVSLFAIPVDVPLPFAVAVSYKGQFIVYRGRGQVFETAWYNRFIYKRISHVYIPNADSEAFHEYTRKKHALREEQLEDPKLTKEQHSTILTVRNLDAVTKELFISDDAGIGEVTKKVIGVAKDTVQRICEQPYLRIFEAIPNNSSVIDHSMRVSLLTTFLGYQLGFVNPLALENLAAAGLLHDIGKTRVALGDEMELTAEQERQIELKHTKLGVEVLKKHQNVPEDVLKIVAEHHEHRDGTGFPEQLRGRQMHALSKVFCIANTFDNLAGEYPGTRDARYRAAAEKMQNELRGWFEPTLLPKALKLLTGT